MLFLNSGGYLAFLVQGGTMMTASAMTANDGNWHHCKVTRNGNLFALFFDGVLKQSTISPVDINTAGALLSIGGQANLSSPTTDFDGSIDEVRITVAQASESSSFTPPSSANTIPAFSGTVLDDTGAPCARTVFIYSRTTGACFASTTSDAGTGGFSVMCEQAGPFFAVALDDTTGLAYNALIYDGLQLGQDLAASAVVTTTAMAAGMV